MVTEQTIEERENASSAIPFNMETAEYPNERSVKITRLEGTPRRGGRRRGRSQRFPVLSRWNAAMENDEEGGGNQQEQVEGRQSRRFPNRRPTVAPVVVA